MFRTSVFHCFEPCLFHLKQEGVTLLWSVIESSAMKMNTKVLLYRDKPTGKLGVVVDVAEELSKQYILHANNMLITYACCIVDQQ